MITGSILLALALESWWGDLADGRAEAATLVSLEAEIASTRSQLLRSRGVHQTRCDAVQALRTTFGQDVESIDASRLGALTREAASVTTLDAPLGVLRGLISSGSLELISDADLRSRLAGWPSRLEDHGEAELYVLNVVRDQWVPWLVANSVLTEDWGRGDAEPPSTTSARTLIGITRDREFQNLVMMQDYYCTFVLTESEQLEVEIEELRMMVAESR